MIFKTLTFFSVVFFSLSAYSQTSDSITYKNHLGIIASPTFADLYKKRAFPVGFIYKRQLKSNQAIRVSAVASFNRQEFINYLPDSSHSFPHERKSRTFQYTFGYEWQKNLRKRWTFFYGGEAGIRFYKNKVAFDLADLEPIPENLSINYSNYTSRNYLLLPFAGIRFNICPRFYAAIETKPSVYYSKQTREDYLFNTFDNPSQEHIKLETYTGNEINVTYFLLSNIQLVYQF